ncbi:MULTISPECIES: hypothetical protein [unclassified Mycobacterium]|uniref:hypothetical protein n=1 Tax=unclassified Mycobacterium TaxID=2642494 RepID=UPI000A90BBFB|nr:MULTISPECIES: hypothetical protein [unclassified Mycobacterium]
MVDFSPEVEAQLAALTDGEWSVLTAKLRAPDTTEMLRSAAAQHISGAQLDAFVAVMDVSKFVGDDGQINTRKVESHLAALYGTPTAADQWGRGGASGRKAAAERHNRNAEADASEAPPNHGPGAAGRAAAAIRHPSRKDAEQ